MTDLSAIRARLEAATPGPWEVQDSCSWRRIGQSPPHRYDDGNVVRPTNHPVDHHPDLQASREDLEFIAHAPQDITDLLALVDAKDAEWTLVSNAYPEPHVGVWQLHRPGVGFFQATVCYGAHAPWWVPREGFTKVEGDPIAMQPDDAWRPFPRLQCLYTEEPQ